MRERGVSPCEKEGSALELTLNTLRLLHLPKSRLNLPYHPPQASVCSQKPRGATRGNEALISSLIVSSLSK